MHKTSKYLFDIQNAISLIEQFTSDVTNFEQYSHDWKTQSAVERQLSIIGEVAAKLRTEGVELKNVIQIVGFRNRLIHSYDSIDASIVWVIIKRHLPELKIEIENM